ncbi:MAG: prepilin-type N-terminal cleavage/methylation domain-containing protein [bacterium]|nr:prepilin-type N-terminal cleavage/methylation domain-containing protein [bacterium]MDD5756271.1 prepilin-type N-terminal cleavage/methylation domain-containing protein [bacterium]
MKGLINLKKTRQQAGFTLLEISIAIIILGYAMLIIAKLFGGVTMSAKANEFGTLASNFARAKMEDLINRDYDSLPEGTWTPDVWAFDVSSALAQKGVLNFTRYIKVSWQKKQAPGSLILTTSESDQGLKKIEIKVIWNERGKQQELIYTSLVTRGA